MSYERTAEVGPLRDRSRPALWVTLTVEKDKKADLIGPDRAAPFLLVEMRLQEPAHSHYKKHLRVKTLMYLLTSF